MGFRRDPVTLLWVQETAGDAILNAIPVAGLDMDSDAGAREALLNTLGQLFRNIVGVLHRHARIDLEMKFDEAFIELSKKNE
jgi:hypothetical protein